MKRKLIPGTYRIYISSEGAVYYNWKRGSWFPYSSSINNMGYARYRFLIENVHRQKLAHRLVAEAFIPNLENKPQVNHKDGDKLNNRISNLEWCTAKENMQHAARIGLLKNVGRGRTIGTSTLNAIRGEYTGEWGQKRKLAEKYSISESSVGRILNNKGAYKI